MVFSAAGKHAEMMPNRPREFRYGATVLFALASIGGISLSSTSAAPVLLAMFDAADKAAVTSSSAQNTDLAPLSEEEPITPIPEPPPADPRKIALGQDLFDDPRLSHDGTRACVSCHDTHSNGATSVRFDKAPNGAKLSFNTITVFNAALNFRFNWEGDFRTLEAKVENSLNDPKIMATTSTEMLGRLKSDRQLVHEFVDAYGRLPDQSSVVDAISVYERSLMTPGSRFDLWLRGKKSALSAEELKGYETFKSLGCISCHQGRNVGGNLFERRGIFHPLSTLKPEILRVPSLRNVAATAPYFHDGSAPTLGDAVRKMGKAQLGRTLSQDQIDAIVAFLKTLTGMYRGRPVVAAAP
jgi:cytochrome c peroxidase